MSTALTVAGSVLGLALIAWPVAVWYEVRRLEKPSYQVLKVLSSKKRAPWDSAPYLEVRKYDPYLVAKVTLEEPDMKKALSTGFKKVAGFIFGGNEPADQPGQSETIAMTSPVVTEKKQGSKGQKIDMTSPVRTQMSNGKYEVAFVMPSKYTRESLPKPKDEDVKIEEVPGHTYGALSWRGWPRPSDNVVTQKREELVEQLSAAGIRVDRDADTRLYQYYPPFAPTFIRLQDVLLPVEYEGSSDKKDE